MRQIFTHIETNAAGAHNGNLATQLHFVGQQLLISHDFGVVDSRHLGHTRFNTSGHDHVIKTGGFEFIG